MNAWVGEGGGEQGEGMDEDCTRDNHPPATPYYIQVTSVHFINTHPSDTRRENIAILEMAVES